MPFGTTINIAMIVVEGLGKKLAPELDLFTYVQPYLMQVVAKAPEVFQQIVTSSTPRPSLNEPSTPPDVVGTNSGESDDTPDPTAGASL